MHSWINKVVLDEIFGNLKNPISGLCASSEMAHTFCICIFVFIDAISAKEHSPKLWQMSCETQCDA